MITEFSRAKKEYSRVEDALKSVRETGYGLVSPSIEELELEEPEIFRQIGRAHV